MEIKSERDPGFYLTDGKIQVYGYTPRNYTKQDIIEYAKLLDDLVSRYNRKEIFANLGTQDLENR
jgi:hypothetical protein